MSARRDTSALAVASLVSGALAYVVFATTTRALGTEQAAPVAVLWTWWGLSAAAITFPVQHWMARSVAAHGGFAAVRAALPSVAGLSLAVAGLAGLVAWLLRDPLFHRDDAGFPALVAALTFGSFAMGAVRGALTAHERFRDLAVTIVAENGLRTVGVIALGAAGVDSPLAYGLVLVAGHACGLAWTSALALPATGEPGPDPRRSALSLLAGASAGQLLAQFVLTGGPLVLAVQGGAATDVTALFVALAVYRAPFIVALGVVPQLTGRVTRSVVEGRHDEVRRLRRTLLAGTAVLGAGAVAVGLWVAPPIVRLVFGADADLPGRPSALLALGSVLAVANLVATVLAIAHGHARIAAVGWLAGMGGAAVVLLTDLAALDRIGTAFLVAEAIAFAVLLGVRSPRTPRSG